ncbi:cyclophilin-like fold protein [Draconibacterium sp. IB214405]|uniref:cyclophilin-like fold protein n=1 Tax=Draconibacterium sp. IB214405 TaxID=3097352 RepID=UPI002A0E571A|nr:cyclophilin-like fold protein [Draconibacterium sp. IB214405]MDX8339417.1 cyclophilin-like fold protein [Draconibacterium sp. IB214405]
MIRKAMQLFSTLLVLISLFSSCEGHDINPVNEVIVNDSSDNQINTNKMILKIGDSTLSATLADNSSAKALADELAKGTITIEMRDYGNMEKVGSLGKSYPTNDESITTEPGDIILYQGNALVIYYAPNTWSFTRLGKIDNTSKEELLQVLGEGNVSVTLSLPED